MPDLYNVPSLCVNENRSVDRPGPDGRLKTILVHVLIVVIMVSMMVISALGFGGVTEYTRMNHIGEFHFDFWLWKMWMLSFIVVSPLMSMLFTISVRGGWSFRFSVLASSEIPLWHIDRYYYYTEWTIFEIAVFIFTNFILYPTETLA